MVPKYLCELVSIRKYSRKLRSSSQIVLLMTESGLKSYGDCAFSVAAPTVFHPKLQYVFRGVGSVWVYVGVCVCLYACIYALARVPVCVRAYISVWVYMG